MTSRMRFFLPPLAALWLVPSVRANNLAYVKCAANQDRVWVYDSLSSFDVETKLRCGAPVEILSRIKGYVKIRTESGEEGYVPDAAFPDLPALPDETKQPLATAAAHSTAALHNPARTVNTLNSDTASSAAPKPVISAETAAKPEPPAAPVAQPAVTASAPAVPAAVAQVKAVAPEKPAASASAPAPATVSAKVSTARTHAKPAVSTTKKAGVTTTNSPAHAAAPAPNLPAAPVVPVPARPVVETVSASARDSAVIVPATVTAVMKADEDSDEYPDTKPENESADPACRIFFAAYGLTPSQYKWMAENRRKEFSGICPAPDVAHVDYVVLFTHDSESYTYAMPSPVHTDHNGFSDFDPLMTADSALVASSELEKAHYEFAWVFHVSRGAFDPAKFSPRRKPLFTTYAKGSRASSRAIEDAFVFVENQGTNR